MDAVTPGGAAVQQINLDIQEGNPAEPWVYLKLHQQDLGTLQGRTQRPEFVARKPSCVRDFSRDSVTVEVSNGGRSASDLVVLEYELIYCSSESHGAIDGYTASHSGEISSKPFDQIRTAAYVPPGASIAVVIPFPLMPGAWLRNLYFRARVMTLWGDKPPRDQWRFATDPRVTEAHLRIAP